MWVLWRVVRYSLLFPNLFTPHVIERVVKVPRYAIDLTPVTNAQYQMFLQDTRYRPRYMENFLKHWRHGGPPDNKVDHPVVYVDLDAHVRTQHGRGSGCRPRSNGSTQLKAPKG